jgi:hypothetical protein
MTIQLTQQESEMHFHNALCNGLGYISDYGLELKYDKADYADARAKLTNPCFEDVLMQILKDGNSLTLVDTECGEDDATITLKEVHERVSKTPLDHLMNAVNENDDAETADVILQTVFLKEIVYG